MSANISVSKSESSYIRTALHTNPPVRADGRSLTDYRTIFLETGVAPLANGSARLNLGKSPQEGGGGTEVIAATKLDVEDIENGEGVEGGRVVCTVSWCVPYFMTLLCSGRLISVKVVLPPRIHSSHPTHSTTYNTTTRSCCTRRSRTHPCILATSGSFLGRRHGC